MKLKNILIVVKDMERSKRFYKDLFGLNVLMDFGKNVILSEGLVLQQQEPWEAATGKTVQYKNHDAELYFEENDMDRFLEALKNYWDMVEYVDRTHEETQGEERRVVRIYDPDHHVIEIGERK